MISWIVWSNGKYKSPLNPSRNKYGTGSPDNFPIKIGTGRDKCRGCEDHSGLCTISLHYVTFGLPAACRDDSGTFLLIPVDNGHCELGDGITTGIEDIAEE